MSGVKGKSGRKKSRDTALKETYNYIWNIYPDLMMKYADYALETINVPLFTYLSDRMEGKATQRTDVTLEAKHTLSTEERAYYIEQMSLMKQEVKQIAIQGSEQEETVVEGEYAEKEDVNP